MALKLAEGEILKSKLNDVPVYLLDDIFSELDEERQGKLARALGDVQSFVTTNDKHIAELFGHPSVTVVEDGKTNTVIPA